MVKFKHMTEGPTKKQKAILKFIEKFSDENNYSPSYREIARALDLSSVSSVAQHIDNCVAAGYLEKIPNEARSLRVVQISDYAETKALFRAKIQDIEQDIEAKTSSEASLTLSDAQNLASLKDDLLTLKTAAKLLKIDLQ